MTTKAIERAAELDLGFACNLGRHQFEIYRKAMRERGKDPSKYSIVNSRIVYIADDADKAWSDIEQAAMYQATLYGKWLSAANPGQNWILPDAKQLRAGAVLGNPETVRTKLAEVIETASPTELIINMQLPGLAPSKAMRSLERFSNEVLPKLR
jgi:alkanesulfonate monooxygenase SsuD/methylene tetrahydromethanopterin reductase-like flavin-dependent oxidoreductase (luciferase family)